LSFYIVPQPTNVLISLKQLQSYRSDLAHKSIPVTGRGGP
jgi:hypothetical protein